VSSSAAAVDAEWFHLLPGAEPSVFLTGGSMLFDIDQSFFDELSQAEPKAITELRALSAPSPAAPLELAPIAALSLNVAQSCNLACAYCYADEGRFGGQRRMMDEAVAFAAIDRLIEQAKGRVTIGFIGGEPFMNRRLVHDSVAYAKTIASLRQVALGFSVTTNATLLTNDDLRLLRDEAFTVTVSLDGDPAQNKNRLDRRKADSTARTIDAVAPLLLEPGNARIAARATLTRDNLDVAERIDWLGARGFVEIGVSPARTGPDAGLRLSDDDWPKLLDQMIRAADVELTRVFAGGAPRFSNLWTALRAIHRGAARPLPCGSVSTYLSVDVDGAVSSCHRTIGAQVFRMGSVDDGFDAERRREFLNARTVDRQEPCRSCWARYLCGGGCHAEVAETGRSGCDYIRGWLDYSLRVYRDIAARRPELLARGAP
jgi:uncharacterized protein